MVWSDSYQPNDPIESFFYALDQIDEKDDKQESSLSELKSWIEKHAASLNKDMIAVENVQDSHGGKCFMNFGAPLYNAVVRDEPSAIKILLEAGADPNWTHPVHGDSAILHCAERGHGKCLQKLLLADGGKNSKKLDLSKHVTMDRKYVIGQGIPQYEEGGLNPLVVCIRSEPPRPEIVDLFLKHLSNEWIRRWLFEDRDAVGNNAMDEVLDVIVLSEAGSRKRDKLEQIFRALASRDSLFDGPLNVPILPAREEATSRRKRRTKIVQDRCCQAYEHRRGLAARKAGLRAVATHYAPLCNHVYDAVCLKKLCMPPKDDSVEENIKGVFSFNLLDSETCQKIWNEIHHYETTAISQPQLGLPLLIRHDGNIGDLQNYGFQMLLDHIVDALKPVLIKCLSDDHGCNNSLERIEIEANHAFLSRNFVGRESNATFKTHRDNSDVTINICLHASEGYRGSTVGFYRNARCEDDTGDVGVEVTPCKEDRIFTHRHEVGKAVVHSGKVWHRTDPITHGTRGSLIIWARKTDVNG